MSPGRLRNASSTRFFETQELPPGRRTSSSCSVARFFLDVVFRGVKLAVDSTAGSTTAAQKSSRLIAGDRIFLVLHGWCVLRFTSAMIDERPAEVMAMVREALEMLGAA